MRKLGLVGSLLVVSAGWHALGACTGDEPIAGVLDAGNKDAALPEAGPPGEGGVASPKLTASAPRAMLRQGGTVEIALTLSRDGIEGDVAVSVTGLPKGVTAEPAVFAGTSTAAKLVLKAAADATLGDATLSLEAKGAPALPFSLLVAGASGTLDTTFDTDGEVLFPKDGPSPYAVVVQPDGKIVAAGGEYPFGVSGKPWFLERINADGTIDTSFHAAAAGWLPSLGEAHWISLEPTSGKIVVTGNSDRRFTIIRATPSGAPDASFAKNGVYRADGFSDPTSSSGHAVQVLPNSDMLVTGRRAVPNGDFFQGIGFVDRFLQNGARDFFFTLHLTSATTNYRGVFSLPGGATLAVGDDTTQHVAVRLLASGAPDPAFGDNGLRTYAPGCQADDATVAPNGDVIIVGRQIGTGEPGPFGTCVTRIAARDKGDARYSIKKGSARFPDTAVAVAGDLTYVSSSAGGPDGAWTTTVERYLADGRLDTTFGTAGTLRLPSTATSAPTIRGLATQADGRLIVVGVNFGGPFVARYWP